MSKDKQPPSKNDQEDDKYVTHEMKLRRGRKKVVQMPKVTRSLAKTTHGGMFGRPSPPPEKEGYKSHMTPKRGKVYEKKIQDSKYGERHRPVRVSTGGTARTPKGTKMTKSISVGSITFFKPIPDSKNEQAPNSHEKVTPSETLQKILKPHPKGNLKRKKIELNYKKLSALKPTRTPSQKLAMAQVGQQALSANQAAKKLGLDPSKGKGYEWLHLVANRFLGKESQKVDNLVLGTKESNTLMMFIENQISELISKYQDETFILRAEATLEPKTHLANEIKYEITCKNIKLDIKFKLDTRSHNNPSYSMKEKIGALFKTALETKKSIQSSEKNDEEKDITTTKLTGPK